MRKMCLNQVYELAKKNPKVFFIGSDLGFETLKQFKQDMPDRFLMEGVSEANLIGISAGLALEGNIGKINGIIDLFQRNLGHYAEVLRSEIERVQCIEKDDGSGIATYSVTIDGKEGRERKQFVRKIDSTLSGSTTTPSRVNTLLGLLMKYHLRHKYIKLLEPIIDTIDDKDIFEAHAYVTQLKFWDFKLYDCLVAPIF